VTALSLESTLRLEVPEARPVRPRIGGRTGLVLVASLLGVFVLLPLLSVFAEALAAGVPAAFSTFADANARSAIALSIAVAVVVVLANGAFGMLAAWTVTMYRFPGKGLLLTLIDLPLTLSPVVAGLAVLLCFGERSPIGAFFAAHGLRIAFAPPGIAVATALVTFPYVARETIALMTETGRELEEAALSLGATVRQTFLRVTLPRARWALLNGLLLCNARALGEFGAVSVVSGHVRGLTETIPLNIEDLYNDSNLVGAFTLAATLAVIAIGSTLLRAAVERHTAGDPAR
jgi:sulfate transport system permease protein